MGCSSTKEKTVANVSDNAPPEAQRFMALVKGGNPVAIRILQEWEVFVALQSNPNAANYNHFVGLEREVWATTVNDRKVSHKDVDEVGQYFLHFLRHELCRFGWGGNFSYSVAGVQQQGFTHISAEVDTNQPGRDVCALSLKLHYHTGTTD